MVLDFDCKVYRIFSKSCDSDSTLPPKFVRDELLIEAMLQEQVHQLPLHYFWDKPRGIKAAAKTLGEMLCHFGIHAENI